MKPSHHVLKPDYSVGYIAETDTYEFRKNCKVTRKPYIVEVPGHGFRCWSQGSLIQNALPSLTPEQREFLLSGLTPAEWDDLFAETGDD